MLSRSIKDYKIYLTNLDKRIKYFVFVHIIEIKIKTPKYNLNIYRFKRIHFNKVTIKNTTLHPITKGFKEIFKEELPGLPLYFKVELTIKLIETLLKTLPIYKISPLKNQNSLLIS